VTTSAYFEEVNLPAEVAWMDEGNCAGMDPDLFFPERGASVKEAKAACAACTVRMECLEYALTTSQKFGIWGGLAERERRRIRSQRARAGRPSALCTVTGCDKDRAAHGLCRTHYQRLRRNGTTGSAT
jgi:WhiB family redox-sensing transcriptional regulator